MKICLTVNSSPWSRFKGGGQIAVHYLASAFTKRGHEVHVIYSKSPEETIKLDTPYEVHWARHFNFQTFNLNIFSFAYVLWQLTGRLQFDVVHGNAEEAFFLPLIAKIRRSKFFFTSHAPFIPSTGFGRGILQPILFLKRINSYFLRSAAKNAHIAFTFSEFSKSLIVGGLGTKKHVQVATPGVNPDWLNAKRSPTTYPQLIFWGRMEDEKGIPELIEALSEVKTVHPKILFHMIGEGNKLDAYRRQRDGLGLADEIVFHEWLDAKEIRRLATACQAGVFPSRIESFGLAVAEAMAAGLPVIASRAGALPEIVEHGKTGVLVPPRDPKCLAKAILNLLADVPKYNKMAKSAKEAARQKFSWALTAEQILSHYHE